MNRSTLGYSPDASTPQDSRNHLELVPSKDETRAIRNCTPDSPASTALSPTRCVHAGYDPQTSLGIPSSLEVLGHPGSDPHYLKTMPRSAATKWDTEATDKKVEP